MLKMTKKLLFIMCALVSTVSLFSEHDNTTEVSGPTNKGFSILYKSPTDKYYVGWLDKRAMISTVFLNHNFDLEETFRIKDAQYPINFSDVFIFFDTRVTKEIQFYRNKYFSIGGAGAATASLYKKEERINNMNYYTYEFAGEFAAYIDIYFQEILDTNLKIRLYPVYHHSTHFVDGYKSSFAQMGGSFEFFGLSAHYYANVNNHSFSPYAGIEATYRYAGNGAPAFKAHIGNDYRFTFSQHYDMSIISGFNVAYIRDNMDVAQLIKNQNHIAVAVGTGVEFHNVVLAAKYRYERGRSATTYYKEQSSIGLEFSTYL